MNGLLGKAFFASLLLVSLGAPTFAQDAVRIVDGRIDVRDDAFRAVFVDEFMLYPGTKVTLDVEFRVDVMRRMYETRECWSQLFGGIWCEYIKRSTGSGIQEDRAPLILDLFERRQEGSPAMAGPVTTSPARVKEGEDPFDVSNHLPALTSTFAIELDDAAVQDAFTRGYVLKGRVANKYKAGESYPDIERRSCDPHRNNESCSQGQYVIHIRTVDTTAREKMLERYLARKRSYSEIAGPDVIDHFMKSEVSDRTTKSRARVMRAAELLVQHARTHYRAEGGIRNEDLRQILEYAVSLDQENVDARNDLVRYHIEAGSLALAKEKGAENLKKYSEDYARGDRKKDTLKGLAQALRNGGQIMLKDRAATDLIDVEVANGFYERAVAVWAEYEKLGHPINKDERLAIAQIHVDQARVLSLIRTATAMQRAIKRLELARIQLPRAGRGTPTAVSSDGQHFLTASFFQPLAEVGSSRVSVGYLPSEEWLPVQVQHSTGEVLLERLDRNGRPSYARWPSRSGSNVIERTITMPADQELQGGRIFGNGLIGLDRKRGELVWIREGNKEVMASKLNEKAQWSSAAEAGVAVLAPGVVNEPVLIWNNGQSLKLDVGAVIVERVAVSPLGKHVQVLQKSDKGIELRIIDVDKLAKGDANASQIHAIDIPAHDEAELLFTQDGQFALQRGQGLLTIVPVSRGQPKVVKLTSDTPLSLQPVEGKRVVVLLRDGKGMVGALSVLDAGEAYASGAEVPANASSPPLETLTFFAEVPFEVLVTSSGGKAGAGAGSLVLLAKTLPALLHVHSFKSGQTLEHRVSSWRHGDAVLLPGGRQLAVRDRTSAEVWLLNLKDDRQIRRFQGGTTAKGQPVTEIVPIAGSQTGGFFHITRDQGSGSVVAVTTYLDAEQEGKRHELPPLTSGVVAQTGWVFLRQPLGHLIYDQARVTFVSAQVSGERAPVDPTLSRQEHDAALAKLPPVSVDVVEVDQAGQVSLGRIEVRDPASIVARLGTSILQRRETGFALIDPKGRPVYLDDCGPKTRAGECDDGQLFFSRDGKSVTNARQGKDALEITQFTLNEDGRAEIAWRCKACGSIGNNDFATLADGFVGALPKVDFVIGPSGDILAPLRGSLGYGMAKDERWTRTIPLARPVALGLNTALVQRDGATFEIWRTN